MTKHAEINLSNSMIMRFIKDPSRTKPLEQALRSFMELKLHGMSLQEDRLKGNVELCYLRKLFNYCHNNEWYLPDVYEAIKTKPYALCMRLRHAIEYSGVIFKSEIEMQVAKQLKYVSSKHFAPPNSHKSELPIKQILLFSYFGERFKLADWMHRFHTSLIENGEVLSAFEYVNACNLCFGALTFTFPVRPSTIGAITVGNVDQMEMDKVNGVCYIKIKSNKTRTTTLRAYPLWLGIILRLIRASRPDVNSDILFIRLDGIEFRRRNLRNYIMRQWIVREPQGVYIGGNARRKSLETALHNDPYDKPGTDRVVEHSRRVGLQRYLLTDTATALLGLQRYIRGYKSLCDSHQIEPPREFIEMISCIKLD